MKPLLAALLLFPTIADTGSWTCKAWEVQPGYVAHMMGKRNTVMWMVGDVLTCVDWRLYEPSIN